MVEVGKKQQDGRLKLNQVDHNIQHSQLRSGLPSNRCQKEIRCLRVLLGNMFVKEQGEMTEVIWESLGPQFRSDICERRERRKEN